MINSRNFHGLSSGSETIFACAVFHCAKSSSTSGRNCKPPLDRGWGIFNRQNEEFSTGVDKLVDPSALLRTYYDYAGLIGLHTEDRMGNTQALIAEIYSAFNHRNTMVHWRG